VGEEALAIALYSVLVAGSYVETIRIASNHDGDSDSTASIAGQLWGLERVGLRNNRRLAGTRPRHRTTQCQGCSQIRP
jgi:hypothetical protein